MGGGSRLLKAYFTVYRGDQMVLLLIIQGGGGPTFSRGGGPIVNFYRNPYNYNL